MKEVFLKAAGALAAWVPPDEGRDAKRVALDRPATLREILSLLDIPEGLVALGFCGGRLLRMDHVPADGETIVLQPPAQGG